MDDYGTVNHDEAQSVFKVPHKIARKIASKAGTKRKIDDVTERIEQHSLPPSSSFDVTDVIEQPTKRYKRSEEHEATIASYNVASGYGVGYSRGFLAFFENLNQTIDERRRQELLALLPAQNSQIIIITKLIEKDFNSVENLILQAITERDYSQCRIVCESLVIVVCALIDNLPLQRSLDLFQTLAEGFLKWAIRFAFAAKHQRNIDGYTCLELFSAKRVFLRAVFESDESVGFQLHLNLSSWDLMQDPAVSFSSYLILPMLAQVDRFRCFSHVVNSVDLSNNLGLSHCPKSFEHLMQLRTHGNAALTYCGYFNNHPSLRGRDVLFDRSLLSKCIDVYKFAWIDNFF